MKPQRCNIDRRWFLWTTSSSLTLLSSLATTMTPTTAFSLLYNHRTHLLFDETKSTRLRNTPDDDPEVFFNLLDESVLLYSRIQTSSMSSNQEIEGDIKNLRKAETTLLIEDIVFAAYEAKNNDERPIPATTPTTPAIASLSDLTKQLDEAILEGYQSTFSPEELDAWTNKIQSLYLSLESRLATPAIEGSFVKEAEMTEPPKTSLESLSRAETRLEELRTLIAPTSSSIQEILEMKQQQQQQNPQNLEAVGPSSPAAEQNRTTATTSTVVSKERSTSHRAEQLSPNDKLKVEGSRGKTTNKKSSIDMDTVNAVISAASLGEYFSLLLFVKEKPHPYLALIHNLYCFGSFPGAVAITKLPLFAAGIVLGPVVQASIEKAQAALDARKVGFRGTNAVTGDKASNQQQENGNSDDPPM